MFLLQFQCQMFKCLVVEEKKMLVTVSGDIVLKNSVKELKIVLWYYFLPFFLWLSNEIHSCNFKGNFHKPYHKAKNMCVSFAIYVFWKSTNNEKWGKKWSEDWKLWDRPLPRSVSEASDNLTVFANFSLKLTRPFSQWATQARPRHSSKFQLRFYCSHTATQSLHQSWMTTPKVSGFGCSSVTLTLAYAIQRTFQTSRI